MEIIKNFKVKIVLIAGLLAFSFMATAVENEENPTGQKSGTDYQLSEKSEKAAFVADQLTFKEKVKLVRELKKEIKKVKKSETKGTPKVILYILAVILPPIAVGIFTDWGEPTLWNLLFTLLFWIPGIVHAFYILLR